MKNVLIVDDDLVFLQSLEELLKIVDTNYRIYTAVNGQQAADILASIPVDILLTDLKMPVMSGQELVLRTRETHPDIPIVVISACANGTSLKEFCTGKYRSFDKPINVHELVGTMRELMQ